MNEFIETGRLVGSLGWMDYSVLAAAVALLLVIATLSGRRERDTRDYFLGGRKVPAVVACLSFVATEVSAVTIVSVPAIGFSENWQYLQFFIGSAAARIFVAFLFIPVFYRHECTTIYQFLRDRFGAGTQYAGSFYFFLTRLIASGVRLYAACMGVSVILGWNLGQTLLLFTAVSIAFIAFGGIKAVVWTGAYETIVFYLAGLGVCAYLLTQIPGGAGEAFRVANEAGRLSVFNFNLRWNDPTTFWAGTANAFFLGLAVFGTDQELMQRLLTVDTRRRSQKAILGTILAALPVTVIYLSVGTLLFVFYRLHPGFTAPVAKEILPDFVRNGLPPGLKGLVLSAVVLASIDSPLSSLSSSFVTDIYRPLLRRNASEKHYLWISRLGVVVFGLILATIAFACQGVDSILWFAFQVVSVTGGSTLGVFLLGILTKRRANRGNIVAMTISAAAMAALLVLSNKDLYGGKPPVEIAWSWLIVIGTATTFLLGWIFSFIEKSTGTNENAPVSGMM
jgi:SSS family transporter